MKPAPIQCIMAENGIMVRELCEQGNPLVLCTLIEHGYGQEYYTEWATHKRKSVRKALAENGYCFDSLIHDAAFDIREIVYEANPEYAKYRLDTTDAKEMLSLVRLFIDIPNPNFEHVQRLLDNPLYHTFESIYETWGWTSYRADIERKADALRCPLSLIEQNMSLWQLFQMDHKRWPAFVNSEQYRFISDYTDTLRTHQRGQEWFNRVIDGDSPFTLICEIVDSKNI